MVDVVLQKTRTKISGGRYQVDGPHGLRLEGVNLYGAVFFAVTAATEMLCELTVTAPNGDSYKLWGMARTPNYS